MLDAYPTRPRGLVEAATFPLIEAIHGRRSRRFAKGATIPNGPLAFASRQAPEPLDPLEQMLLIATIAGNTGWAELFAHHPDYAARLPNYTTAAGGRSFPSSAGFNTSEFFFTDDSGVYFLPTRDMTPPAVGRRHRPRRLGRGAPGAHRQARRRAAEHPGRDAAHGGAQHLVRQRAGSTLIFPVADVAQHIILLLLYLVQNGTGIFDDVNGRPIPGLERYAHRLNLEVAWPMSFVEQIALTDVSVEMGTACYAGALMLQALGLGRLDVHRAQPLQRARRQRRPGGAGPRLPLRDARRAAAARVTGREGVFEAHVPPHHTDMRAAVEAAVGRKFGAGGPFDPTLGGPYKENGTMRSGAAVIDAEAIEITALMAEYVFSTFGRFPATVPAVFIKTYLQAHRLDTEFYDRHFAPGAYLRTHAEHDRNWG